MKVNTVLNVLILLAIILSLLGIEVDTILLLLLVATVLMGLVAFLRGVAREEVSRVVRKKDDKRDKSKL